MTAAFFIVLKVLGWLLAAVLLIVLLLLLCPLQIHVLYENENLTLRGGMLGLTVPLYPFPAKKEKDEEKKAAPLQEPQGEKTGTKKKPRKTPDAEQVLQILHASGWAVKKLCRSVRIRAVRLRCCVQEDDAAQTALAYGRLHTALAFAAAAVQQLFDVQVEQVSLYPDFTGQQEPQKHFSCKICARLYIIGIIAVYVLYKAVSVMRRTAEEP